MHVTSVLLWFWDILCTHLLVTTEHVVEGENL